MNSITQNAKLIPLSQVPRLNFLPCRRNGRKLHPSTVFRWAQRGLRGVKLQVVRVGGTLCTTEDALCRFFEQLTGGVNTPPPIKRNRAQVQRELDEAGIR